MRASRLHETTTTSYEIMQARAQARAVLPIEPCRSQQAEPDAALSPPVAPAAVGASDARSAPWRTPWLLLWTL
jgi:hypothetical protein